MNWRIPPAVLDTLASIPTDRAVVVLLRHSVRNALPPGREAYVLPITEVGWRLGQQLGELLRERLQSLHASPLTRCVQTAEALREGAQADLPITTDRMLGDPGAYVLDGDIAWENWKSLGHEGVMEHLVSNDDALPGMARPGTAARFLVQHMLAAAGASPGVHVFVTHDSLVTATAARFLGRPLGLDAWPWFLEGAFFWRANHSIKTAYQGETASLPSPLCPLTAENVIEFARREVAKTIGLHCPARFFLAGGAFKTLLTGKAPRDLDLWTPSVKDRALLVDTLTERGAKVLPGRPFADAFELSGRVLEIPHATAPETLRERLARFDIALSAIGVEHRPGEGWSAEVHPLAVESVRRRKVLLLKPLRNWKYALVTLERMRRYAHELGFTSPASEEAEVWDIFDAASADIRRGMTERYERTAGAFNVPEELACRLQ